MLLWIFMMFYVHKTMFFHSLEQFLSSFYFLGLIAWPGFPLQTRPLYFHFLLQPWLFMPRDNFPILALASLMNYSLT